MTEPRPAGVPAVIGHRGACGHAPENTLASIHKAAALGVRWVEFDTKLSRDGHVILFHDDKLKRTTGAPGAVADWDLADLQALDAGGWYASAFKGEPVPTLRQAMAVLAGHGLGANVEIKASPGREDETGRMVAGLLRDEWPAGLPVPLISSFDPVTLAAARDAAPDIPRALLVFRIPRDWRRRMEDAGCTALHCRHRELTPGKARAVVDAGFPLRCFTVNEPQRAETLYGWGVQAVISDHPDRLPRR